MNAAAMSTDDARFARARKIADAVLYEGYLLYPYRSSSSKNQMRWQFGVLAPRAWCDAGGNENAWSQTECLLELEAEAHLHGRLRFLQVQRRHIEVEGQRVESIEVGGQLFTSWDEAVDQQFDFQLALPATEKSIPFEIPGGLDREDLPGLPGAFIVRERWPIRGELTLVTETVQDALVKLHLRVENVTACATDLHRDAALQVSMIGAHTVLVATNSAFLSLVDPPDYAKAAVAGCANVRTWPVLAGATGERDMVLSSPIILYDHPEIAAESPGDLYDGLEIDEILTLRTMTLTDDEKREARATDARAAAIIDRSDSMPVEMLEKLHGAIRGMRAVPHQTPVADPFADIPVIRTPVDDAPPTQTPAWWDPGADASVSPETDTVEVAGVLLAKGARVKLKPGAGKRRSDAQDMFLVDRIATVTGVYIDVEEQRYLAVSLADEAGDLHAQHGRFLYFYPDEVEAVQE